MDVMDLMAKIGLDDNDFDKKLDEDGSKFSNFGSKLASGAKTVAKVGVAAFATIGTAIGGATTALFKNADATATLADQIDKESQKLGISAEAYQEWDAILQHTGGDISNLKPAIKTLSKSIESGSDAFGKLGISMEEVQGLSKEDLFAKVITQLQGMEDGTERTALAQELLGRSSMELGALLNTSAEDTEKMRQTVHDLGGVMSDDAVKAGAAFKDSLQDMKTALNGAKNNLMSSFLPSLTTAMDGLTALFTGDDSGIAKIKEGIEGLAQKLSEKLPKALEAVGGIAESLISALPSFFDVIAQQLPSLIETLIPVLINAIVGLADAIVNALPKIMDAINKNISVITQGLSKIIKSLGQIILKLVPSLLPTMIKVAVELIKELAKGFSENASEVIKTIIELINMIVQELTNPDTLMTLLECGIEILTALVNGIAENLPLLLETIGMLIVNITTFLVEAIPELVIAIGKNGAKIITDVLPQIILSIGQAGADLLLNISDTIAGWIPDLISGATEAFESIGQGALDAWDWIWEQISGIGQDILDGLAGIFEGIWDIGANLLYGLWDGIQSAWDYVWGGIEDIGESILGGLQDVFSIFSPSKKTAWMGEMLMEGFAVGMEDEADEAFDDMQRTLNKGFDGIDVPSLEANASVDVSASGNSPILSAVNKLFDKLEEIEFHFTLPVFVGDKQIDEVYVESKQRIDIRSGGQVNV